MPTPAHLHLHLQQSSNRLHHQPLSLPSNSARVLYQLITADMKTELTVDIACRVRNNLLDHTLLLQIMQRSSGKRPIDL